MYSLFTSDVIRKLRLFYYQNMPCFLLSYVMTLNKCITWLLIRTLSGIS